MVTAVFFHAHPDDESLSTAGTMALLSEAGHRVVLVVATRGEEGEPVPGVLGENEALADRRMAELYAAADLLGTARVEFLGYRDSGMADTPTNANPDCFWQAEVGEAVDRLGTLLAGEQPDLLVVYDPNGGYGHPDHLQVHRVGIRWAASAGVEKVRWVTLNRDAIRETLEMAIASGVADGMAGIGEDLEERRRRAEEGSFGSAASDITHAVAVDGFLDRKRAAIAAHASQIPADSFFLTIPPQQFSLAFGTEWFIDPEQPREPGTPFRTDLLDH
ncbi:MAG: PIG-L family deacetylase [Actinomycetota bacterium]|nr:PIG-L family deacetylase [Actinomycetota bacterium]